MLRSTLPEKHKEVEIELVKMMTIQKDRLLREKVMKFLQCGSTDSSVFTLLQSCFSYEISFRSQYIYHYFLRIIGTIFRQIGAKSTLPVIRHMKQELSSNKIFFVTPKLYITMSDIDFH